MAKNADRQDEQMNNQAEREGEKAAAKEGESAPVAAAPLEEQVNPMSAAEEAERQQAEAYPRMARTFAGQHEEGPEKARQGHASTHRARVGRVVVVHEDTVHEGEVYKAGVQDIELSVADALLSEEKAYEPAGKKRGR